MEDTELISYYYDNKIYVTTDFICKDYNIDRKTLSIWNKKGLKNYKLKNLSKSNLYMLREVDEWKQENINAIKSNNAKRINVEVDTHNEQDGDEESNLLEKYEKATVEGKRKILRKIGLNRLDELKKIEDIIEKEAKNKEWDSRYVLVDKVKKGEQELASMFISFLKTSMPVLSKELENKKQDEIYHALDRYYNKEINNLVKFIEKDEEVIVAMDEVIKQIIYLILKTNNKMKDILKKLIDMEE
jgi:hypothetical protein